MQSPRGPEELVWCDSLEIFSVSQGVIDRGGTGGRVREIDKGRFGESRSPS